MLQFIHQQVYVIADTDTLTRALVKQFSNKVDEEFFMIRSWSDHVTKLR
jgi:hypothetical protein